MLEEPGITLTPISPQVWSVGPRPKRGVTHLHAVPGVCMAADWTVSSGFRVQRVVPHSDPRACPFLPVWQLPGQQPTAERGPSVSKTNMHSLPSHNLKPLTSSVYHYRLKERTYSLWAHLLSEKQNYLNPAYSPSFAESHPVLEPSTQANHFKYRWLTSSVYKWLLLCLDSAMV